MSVNESTDSPPGGPPLLAEDLRKSLAAGLLDSCLGAPYGPGIPPSEWHVQGELRKICEEVKQIAFVGGERAHVIRRTNLFNTNHLEAYHRFCDEVVVQNAGEVTFYGEVNSSAGAAYVRFFYAWGPINPPPKTWHADSGDFCVGPFASELEAVFAIRELTNE